MVQSASPKGPTMREEIEIVLGQVYPDMRDVARRVFELSESQAFHIFGTLRRTDTSTTYIKEAFQTAFDDIVK